MTIKALEVGQRVFTNLYNRGFGTIVAIHGDQSPESCGSMLGGVMRTGGTAKFDIAFDGGESSSQLPETILRGVQWRIFDEVVGADEVARATATAADYRVRKNIERADAEAAHAAAVACLKASPDFAFLTAGGEAAANIRKHLKHVFPETKFSVRVSRGGRTVLVRWTDGPSASTVESIVDRYQAGHFDGMSDGYVYDRSAWVDAFGGAQYVSTNREYSDELIEHAIAEAFAVHALPGIERPTVEEYRRGNLWHVRVSTMLVGVDSLQLLIGRTLRATEVTAGTMTTSHGED